MGRQEGTIPFYCKQNLSQGEGVERKAVWEAPRVEEKLEEGGG